MPSTTLPLGYLIDAFVELQLGSDARVRALEEDERALWRHHTRNVENVARATLAGQLATPPDVPPVPPDDLFEALVGAARCRRLEGGSPAHLVFSVSS